MPVDISKDFRKYVPVFRQTHEQGINEAEVSLRISKFFEEVLGYDIFEEISKEHMIKDRYVDYAIILGGKTEFLIEVKQGGHHLKGKAYRTGK